MRRQIQAQRFKLLAKPVHAAPVLERLHMHGLVQRVIAAEQAVLAGLRILPDGFRKGEDGLDILQQFTTVAMQGIERARPDQVFHLLLVGDGLRKAFQEICQVGELTVRLAFGNKLRHRLGTDIADGAKRIAHRRPAAILGQFDCETGAGPVHIRWPHLDLLALAFLTEDGQLVGAAGVERHGSGKEFLGIIGFEIGRLIGHQRIGRRVRLVETVAGKRRDLVEHVGGKLFAQVILDGAGNEGLALLVHLGLDLLAHGPPQQVGTAKRVTGQDPRRLLHLLLIDHDAVGFGQNGLQLGMHVGDERRVVLPRHIMLDILHRAGAIKRDNSDDVLETVRLQAFQNITHTGGFQLEHADRVAGREHLEGPGVIQRNGREVDLDTPPGKKGDSPL